MNAKTNATATKPTINSFICEQWSPTPITKAAKVPPTERQVYKLARSLASKP